MDSPLLAVFMFIFAIDFLRCFFASIFLEFGWKRFQKRAFDWGNVLTIYLILLGIILLLSEKMVSQNWGTVCKVWHETYKKH